MTFTTRMKRKILRNMDCAPCGGSGTYVQLSRTKGIKLLNGRYNLEELKRYGLYDRTLEEARSMKLARRHFPYIPKCYGVKMLKINGYYNIGIIIQHLGNKRIADIMPNGAQHIIYKLEERLQALGICHNDIHSQNVMYFKNKYWVIDFAHVTISKPNQL